MTEVERPALTALFNRAVLPEAERDGAAAGAAEETLPAPLAVLGASLLGLRTELDVQLQGRPLSGKT